MEAVAFGRRPRSELRSQGRPPHVLAALRILILVASLMSQVGCTSLGDVTNKMVPSCWRGNPWGPAAEVARSCGQLPTIPMNPRMIAWEAWAQSNLQDGDLVFRMGDARVACGLYPFSRVSAEMAGSRFSHSGIVCREAGEVVVYDTHKVGPRRQPFAVWVLDATGGIAVKRPRADYQHFVSQAVRYCRQVYHRQVPFDRWLRLDDERLYCIEMSEKAYESAGLVLSEPIPIKDLPRYHDFPKAVGFARLFTSLHPSQSAYVIGNDSIGIWASPALELVYESHQSGYPGVTSTNPSHP